MLLRIYHIMFVFNSSFDSFYNLLKAKHHLRLVVRGAHGGGSWGPMGLQESFQINLKLILKNTIRTAILS